jgi:hypothetical protein
MAWASKSDRRSSGAEMSTQVRIRRATASARCDDSVTKSKFAGQAGLERDVR